MPWICPACGIELQHQQDRPLPRVVVAGDENRLTGTAGLPLVINPYIDAFGTARPVAGAIRPAAGSYDVVFDTVGGMKTGAFTFRFWINDVMPPTVRLLTPSAKVGSTLRLTVADSGSGVDPFSIEATIDGKPARISYRGERLLVALGGAVAGRHRLVVRASDYQELKNMENVPQILPNTRVRRASFRVQ